MATAQTEFIEALAVLAVVFLASPPICFCYYYSVNTIFHDIYTLAESFASQNAQVLAEKRKGERLLHRMLPPYIAECLKKGQSVAAEHFDSTTVRMTQYSIILIAAGLRI